MACLSDSSLEQPPFPYVPLFSRDRYSHTTPGSRVNSTEGRLTRGEQHDIHRTGHILNDIEWRASHGN